MANTLDNLAKEAQRTLNRLNKEKAQQEIQEFQQRFPTVYMRLTRMESFFENIIQQTEKDNNQ